MSTRFLHLLGFATVIIILTTGFYIEFTEGFEPCPLCTLQRICFVTIGCLFFLNVFMYNLKIVTWLINFLTTLTSLIGTLLAGRQIWLQTLPPSGDCSLSFRYMLETFPLRETIVSILHGSADCAERGWELFNLNLAELSFISFSCLLLLSLYLWTRRS